MTDEQIEYLIGLEQVRNVIEGFDREHGLSEIRKLIEEVKNEKKELETPKCSRCYKTKNCNEFTSPHKLCNTCLDDQKIVMSANLHLLFPMQLSTENVGFWGGAIIYIYIYIYCIIS